MNVVAADAGAAAKTAEGVAAAAAAAFCCSLDHFAEDT
jgi:hypothetical protein